MPCIKIRDENTTTNNRRRAR